MFRISPSGSYTSLYSFGSSPNDGAYPWAGLVQGGDGNFYGTAYYGGTNGNGTVFRFSVPLNPSPNQIAAVQLSGRNAVFVVPCYGGARCQLQFTGSMNPPSWADVPGVSVTNKIGGFLTVTNVGGAVGPQGFYRFDITP